MGKRVDHDATQDVSVSQLVPDAKPPPVYGNVPRNDASAWMQQPVNADDFLSGPNKRPAVPGRGGRGAVVAVIALLLVGVTGAGAWYAFLRAQPATTKAPAVGDKAPVLPAVTSAVDAAVETVVPTADAALANAAAVDAGAPVAAMLDGVEVDAVTAAGPALKKAKKRPATRGKIVKKKTAKAAKKR